MFVMRCLGIDALVRVMGMVAELDERRPAEDVRGREPPEAERREPEAVTSTR